ncbi:MAG: serine/threonine protein kinase [bacterium]|nr:serine/threonine protein kinase [bacterium]
MLPDRWKRIQEIFELALDAAPEDRDAVVRRACQDDNAMYAEVMALLAADAEGHPMLDRETPFNLPQEDPQLIGTQIGSYRLIAALGEGGMGAVYLADRVDGQFEQRVAIKVVQPSLRTKVILRRFQQERQILAHLNHPNIARLLDGGLTPDGRPYFVMEYVDGVPIDQYCQTRGLSLAEKLRLILQACEAVEFAHSNLVIHRDLKPANILVDQDGRVKVIDFGIAKVLAESADVDMSVDLTQTGFRAMTPRYASPEQVRNQPITTASDVYSLGVVLYELLTGRYPYKTSMDSGPELEQAVVTQEPERPSSVVLRPARKELSPIGDQISTKKLQRQLRGDLDTICMAALRKDLTRRYQTARQLTDDIRRYLDGWPIEARMDSVPYMVGKFVRRHRPIVFASILAIVAIAVTIGFYTNRLASERDKARLEARKSREIAKFLTGIFEVSDPNESRGTDVTARELLDTAITRLRTELKNQPAVKAMLLRLAADILYNLGHIPQSRELAFESAELNRITFGEHNLEYADNLLQLTLILDDAGERDSALSVARKALSIVRDIYPDRDTNVANMQVSLGHVYRHLGNFDSAEVYYRAGLETQRELEGDTATAVGNTLNHLGRLYYQRGEYAKAEPIVREAIATLINVFGREDHFEVIASRGNLGAILMAQERYAEAESVFVRNRALLASMVGTDHTYYGGMTTQLASAVYMQGRIEEAHALYLEALDLARKYLPEEHQGYISVLLGLGRLLTEHGDFRDAEPFLRQALSIRLRTLPAGHWHIAGAQSSLADCLRKAKRFEEGAPLALEAYTTLMANFGSDDPRTTGVRKKLELLYSDWGKPIPELDSVPAS